MLALLKFIAWFTARLPLGLVLWSGRCWGAVFGLAGVRQRRRADLHLAMCLPEVPAAGRRAIRRRMFRHLGMNAAEMLRWMGGATGELNSRIRLEGGEHMVAAQARGRGVVVLTAHLGNWDLMGLWAASRYPLTIISKTIKNEAVNRFWMEKRAAAGLHIVAAHHSYRACLSALKKGGLLGFILDQNMIAAEGIFVEFFGRPACTTAGLAVLAAHARAPIVPVFMFRRPDGDHVVRMLPALDPPAERTPAAMAATTQACTRIVEQQVREHPDQWIWMHRRWRTQPPAQKG